MATVSTVSISGVSYDVYGTETEIKQYIAGRLGTDAYDDASSTDKKKAHVQATRWIDRERWSGQPTDLVTPQPLQFPREDLTDCNGNAVDEDTLPQEVCNATGELILIILADPAATAAGNTSSNIKNAKAGSAEVEFFRPGDSSGGTGTILPTEAWKWMRCFSGGGVTPGTASGTDGQSQFDNCDRATLNDGFA